MRKSDRVKKPEFVQNNKQVHFIGRGIECQVFEIVKMKLVCKVYDTDADAKYSYTLQRIAYRAGIGPEPLGLEKNYYFSRYIESCDEMENPPKQYGTKEWQDFLGKIVDIFGDNWNDNHSGNIGVIRKNGRKNGKVQFVIIDFGIAGFITTDLGSKLAKKLGLIYDSNF